MTQKRIGKEIFPPISRPCRQQWPKRKKWLDFGPNLVRYVVEKDDGAPKMYLQKKSSQPQIIVETTTA
jgi:hypothetical protein